SRGAVGPGHRRVVGRPGVGERPGARVEDGDRSGGADQYPAAPSAAHHPEGDCPAGQVEGAPPPRAVGLQELAGQDRQLVSLPEEKRRCPWSGGWNWVLEITDE